MGYDIIYQYFIDILHAFYDWTLLVTWEIEVLIVILNFIFREKKQVKIYCEKDYKETYTPLDTPHKLALWRLFKALNGSSTSSDTFSGPIGQILFNDDQFHPWSKRRYREVTSNLVNFSMEQIILMDLSCDQRIPYQYSIWVSSASVRESWINWKIGHLHRMLANFSCQNLGFICPDNNSLEKPLTACTLHQNVCSPVWLKLGHLRG